MRTRKQKGGIGENIALKYLLRKGFKLRTQNFGYKGGEIDLIVQKKNLIVFVEVRSKKGNPLVSPIESVIPAKQEKIIRTAYRYLENNNLLGRCDCRFDIISVLYKDNGMEIEHLKDAFRENM